MSGIAKGFESATDLDGNYQTETEAYQESRAGTKQGYRAHAAIEEKRNLWQEVAGKALAAKPATGHSNMTR